jgi:hypothetical protein
MACVGRGRQDPGGTAASSGAPSQNILLLEIGTNNPLTININALKRIILQNICGFM